MAMEIATCSAKLRELYALDLNIWALQGTGDMEVPEHAALKAKANDVFGEIKRMVDRWQNGVGDGWTVEEWRMVGEIRKAVNEHPVKRY